MNRTRKKLIPGIVVLVIAMLMSVIFGALQLIGAKNLMGGEPLKVRAEAPADSYASFSDGNTYRYSNYSRYETYAKVLPTRPAGYDTYSTEVVIDTAQERGTLKNPYVIDSNARWNQFAADMQSDATKGAGKVYCLARDLTFDTGFTPVPQFAGTFYGLSYTITYTYTVPDNNNNAPCGAFRYLGSSAKATSLKYNDAASSNVVVVADLKVDYTVEMTHSASAVGGIAGAAINDSTVHIINCHTKGGMTGDHCSTLGGLVGALGADDFTGSNVGSNKCTLYMEGCSAYVTLNSCLATDVEGSRADLIAGGALGVKYLENRLNILGCYTDLRATTVLGATGKDVALAGAVAKLGHGCDVTGKVKDEKIRCVNQACGTLIAIPTDIANELCESCQSNYKLCPGTGHEGEGCGGNKVWISNEKSKCDSCDSSAPSGEEEDPDIGVVPLEELQNQQVLEYRIDLTTGNPACGYSRVRYDWNVSNLFVDKPTVQSGNLYCAQTFILDDQTDGLRNHLSQILYKKESGDYLYPYMVIEANYDSSSASVVLDDNQVLRDIDKTDSNAYSYIPYYSARYPKGEKQGEAVLLIGNCTYVKWDGGRDNWGENIKGAYVPFVDKDATMSSGSNSPLTQTAYDQNLIGGAGQGAKIYVPNCWKLKNSDGLTDKVLGPIFGLNDKPAYAYTLDTAPNLISIKPDCRINFYNYTGSVYDEALEGFPTLKYSFSSEAQEVSIIRTGVKPVIPEPTMPAAGLTFKGWTDSPEAFIAANYTAGEGVTLYDNTYTIPKGKLGVIKLYAVWEIETVTAQLLKMPADNELVADGKNSYRMIMSFSHDGFAATGTEENPYNYNLAYSYGWQKGEPVEEGSLNYNWTDVECEDQTLNYYEIKTQAESGTYRGIVTISCTNYPLLFGKGTSDTKSFTLIGADITQLNWSTRKFTTTNDVYYQMKLSEVEFTLQLENNKTHEWVYVNVTWTYPNMLIQESVGDYPCTITVPGYNGSRSENISKLDFNAGQLKFIFRYKGTLDYDAPHFQESLESGSSFTAQQVIQKFIDMYTSYTETFTEFWQTTRRLKMPYLKDSEDTQYKRIYEFDKEYIHRTKSIIIDFEFRDEKFDVEFVDGETRTIVQVAWDDVVPLSSPDSKDDPHIFDAWYVTNGNTVTNTKWNATDTLRDGNKTLTAKYKDGYFEVQQIVAARNVNKNLTALDTVQNEDFEVKVYLQKRNSSNGAAPQGITAFWKVLSLSPTNNSFDNFCYKVQCYAPQADENNRVYHVETMAGSTCYTWVEFSYITHNYVTGSGVQDDTRKVKLSGVQVPLQRVVIDTGDTSGIEFKPSNTDWTGSALEIKPISPQSYAGTGITGVEYIYYDGSDREVSPSDVVGDQYNMVEYKVEAKFKTDSDHIAASKFTQFIIYPKRKVVTPTMTWGNKSYNGQKQLPTFTVTYSAEGSSTTYTLDATMYTLTYYNQAEEPVDPNAKGEFVNAGTYTVVFAIVDDIYHPENPSRFYRLADIEQDDEPIKKFTFEIKRRTVERPKTNGGSSFETTYNGQEQRIKDIAGLTGIDDRMIVSGDETARNARDKEYSITIFLKDPENNRWANEGLGNPVITWKIYPVTLVTKWEQTYKFDYNGEVQYPKVIDLEGLVPGDTFDPDVDISYQNSNNVNGGSYKVTAVLAAKSGLNGNYVLDLTEATQRYTIVGGPAPGSAGGADEYGGSGIKNAPVWQLIVGAVSAILIVVFVIMSVNYAGSTKKANEKKKQLAQMTYSVAPLLPLLMATKWGLPEIAWTVMAIALAAGAFAMGIVTIILRKKNVLALDQVAAEEHRLEMEKAAAAAREAREERRRQDEQFRQMFAGGFAGGFQNNFGALGKANIPAMGAGAPVFELDEADELEALPAGSPDYSALEDVINRQKQIVMRLKKGASPDSVSSERAELDRIVRNVDKTMQGMGYIEEYERLKSTVNRQNSAINMMISELKSRSKGGSGASAGASAGAGAGAGGFAEAYKNLSPKTKSLYNSFIGFAMGKPDMVRVEGANAVMLRYKGKSLFKTYIKNGNPYLCYMADNGSQAEICLNNEKAVEEAKKIVDARIRRLG